MTDVRFALETPIPLVDLDRMERNLDRMAHHAAIHGLGLRPHIKTHKAPRVAAEQVHRGAMGLTCATPREAEVMARVHADLLVAHPPANPIRTDRLLGLPPETRLLVALDSVESADLLVQAVRRVRRPVRVVVELDLGMHRVGVAVAEDAVALARFIRDHPPLEFAGIGFYPGHIRQHVSQQPEALALLARDLAAVLRALEQAGLPPAIVSGGSTPTAWNSHLVPGLTEIRPGTYVYNDRATVATGACTRDECAFTVLATVISTAVAAQAVVDAGSKALGREPRAGDESFGELLDHPEVTVRAMSEEHGILDLSRTAWRPRVGDQVRIIPNHVCVAVHLFDATYGVRGGEVVERWSVAARGR
jgi:D-serine deaminase-like pyridoxal phosphate-dependent protein